MPATLLHLRRQQRWIQAALLSLLAIGLNLLHIEIFFGFELLLGSSLAVLALLALGDIGLLVGLSTSLVTWKVWGYPWCTLMMIAELLWLLAYLNQFGKSESTRTNGRIILADIVFWTIIGVPLVFLLFGVVINLAPSDVLLLAIKQSANGTINTTIGFSLYLAYRISQSHSDQAKAVTLHGLTVATVMLSMIIPSLMILSISSDQLVQASQRGELERLKTIAAGIAVAPSNGIQDISDALHDSGALVEFEQTRTTGPIPRFQSNPGLFRTLSQTHSPAVEATFKGRGLELLTSQGGETRARHLINGYWKFDLAKARFESISIPDLNQQVNVVVVEPARELILQLQQQSTRIVGILAWSLLFAALISEILAQAISKQFGLTQRHPATEVQASAAGASSSSGLQKIETTAHRPFNTTFLLDLNRIIHLLNQKSESIDNLRSDLQSTSLRLKTSREEVVGLSTTDPLTGCHNRHELYRRLDFELQRSNRDNSELSCMSFEVDHYNQIRDSYGQAIAEQVLIELAADIQARARTTDCLCRSSEAAFSLVLPMCSLTAAEGLAQTFRRAVEKRVIKIEDQQISVTISIGIACLKTGNDDSESLITRAENALYRAKVEGRNRIVMT